MASHNSVRKGVACLVRQNRGKRIVASSEADLKEMIGVPDVKHGVLVDTLLKMRKGHEIGAFSVGHGQTYIQA